jgi:hypothetical protein
MCISELVRAADLFVVKETSCAVLGVMDAVVQAADSRQQQTAGLQQSMLEESREERPCSVSAGDRRYENKRDMEILDSICRNLRSSPTFSSTSSNSYSNGFGRPERGES